MLFCHNAIHIQNYVDRYLLDLRGVQGAVLGMVKWKKYQNQGAKNH